MPENPYEPSKAVGKQPVHYIARSRLGRWSLVCALVPILIMGAMFAAFATDLPSPTPMVRSMVLLCIGLASIAAVGLGAASLCTTLNPTGAFGLLLGLIELAAFGVTVYVGAAEQGIRAILPFS